VVGEQHKLQAFWTIVYVVLSAAGIVMAIPPGYASPIFPAAGFAVAIMLWSPRLALPTIVLGSFLLNYYLTRNLQAPILDSAMIALLLGLGAGLQAHVAAKLVQKLVGGEWRHMESANSILLSLLVAGPLACLIAASNATLVLYAFKVISAEELAYSWWNWWVGDSLGVLVMLPICIALLCRHEYAWKNRIRLAFMPILLIILMVAMAFLGAARLEKEYFKKEVMEQGETFKFLLLQRFTAHQEVIASLRRLLEVTPEMTNDQFEYFTRITLMDNPDIHALSINAVVLADERADYEQRMRHLLDQPEFQILEKQVNGKWAPAAARSHHVVVQYISPSQPNTAVIGYDINSEPLRRSAISASMTSGKPTVTEPLYLLVDPADTPALLVLDPAFRQHADPKAEPRIFAFAVAVLKINDMIEAATARARNPKLLYRIFDAAADPSTPAFYQSISLPSLNGQDFMANFDLMVADRLWRIEVLPTQAYLQEIRSWTAWVVGVGGLFAVVMLQVLILIITGQNSLIRRKVDEQTHQLRAKSDLIAERNAQLDAIFHSSPDGFIVFSDNGTIKYVNPALVQMLAFPDVSGMKEAELDAFLFERLEKGQRFSGIADFFAAPEGQVSAHILNLMSPKKLSLQVLGIHTRAASIPRILYLRDVTQEFEIQQMKSDFLSHAAHELRTPMTTILGYTELLLTREYSKEVRDELLLIVQRQTNLIVTMINDLLDLARIEANIQPKLHFLRVDLAALIKELKSELTFDQQRWPVTLILPEAPVCIQGDQQKLRQAFMNLIVNAQKYSPEGGEIVIRLTVALEHTLLSIEDHGIGMTETELGHIGEKFWRADTSGSSPGTGLGVSIVREIVHSHGGTLHFSSALGQGTKAMISLPIDSLSSH
jgi:signal transduction histidine kinase/integral membrane sensor domain MASE1